MLAWSVLVDVSGIPTHATYFEEGDMIIFKDGTPAPFYEYESSMIKLEIVEFPISFFSNKPQYFN